MVPAGTDRLRQPPAPAPAAELQPPMHQRRSPELQPGTAVDEDAVVNTQQSPREKNGV